MAHLLSPHSNGDGRPNLNTQKSAPVIMNQHFAPVGETPTREQYEHGIQVIDENKDFNPHISTYLSLENVIPAGFNYHLISVFGSQSTGKSTLLNCLFGTDFGVMSEQERRQTTKGIWMSKNKRESGDRAERGMADNILVMDVEGTDGRERGEDQDFERKSALFALATSEVLIVNMWEHQVGLYQGANMGLLKTVFEVNLQLFIKGNTTIPKSLLFFVIRDHIGPTPLSNLRTTILQDLSRMWAGISKPQGLENSKIDDYFDFAFVGLPHKNLQPEKFIEEVDRLSKRFREGYKDPKREGLVDEHSQPVFLPQYHRRIPADGFPMYAEGIWDQIVSNKDLDLPTQQELLAQHRCDEIAREVLVIFDESIVPLEDKQARAAMAGSPVILSELGKVINAARSDVLSQFDGNASRYHKGVYTRIRKDLEAKVDSRLKVLSQGQLSAAHKTGVHEFSQAVSTAVKRGKDSYDFAEIVAEEKTKALARFQQLASAIIVEGAAWSDYTPKFNLFRKDLDEVSGRLRKEEMLRLATRVERWVRNKLREPVHLEFKTLGSGRGGSGAPEEGEKPTTEKDLWDRIWKIFTETVEQAEMKFTERARSFDANPEEVEVGLWRLRRKSWGVLRAKIDEEVREADILQNLREHFEEKFRYDENGTPRIWRPTDDIEGLYTKARESTVTLIPLLSRFRLSTTSSPPPLDAWVGFAPGSIEAADREDLPPIGGVDEEDEGKSLEEEMAILTDAQQQDLTVRFKKMADGMYVDAKRGALGGVTQVPFYFYVLLLLLGWNEIMTVLRNPLLIMFMLILGAGAYVTYTLNLWGPMLRMANAASTQAVEIAKEKLREFLESSETGRQAMAMSGRNETSPEQVRMHTLGPNGKRAAVEEDDLDDI